MKKDPRISVLSRRQHLARSEAALQQAVLTKKVAKLGTPYSTV
jgi:hypothetical protein